VRARNLENERTPVIDQTNTERGIRPINTLYRGYWFRSRLEARWAVFFDYARVIYQYEVEGFHLPSGNYLPDFYCFDCSSGRDAIPRRAFIEVKPLSCCPEGCTTEELNSHLAWDPDPWPREVILGRELVTGMHDTGFVAVYGDPMDALFNHGGAIWVDPHGKIDLGIGPLDYIPASLWDAASAARAARFEAGE
jgi:hypothetical protein